MYMWANMNSRIPSINTPIFCKSIESLIIYDLVGDQPDNVEFTIWNESHIPILMLWNPLDEFDGDEIPSTNGPPGTIAGSIDTVPGKFDNAIQATAADSGLTFPQTIINKEQGIISWWMTTTEDVIDGVMQNVTGNNRMIALGGLFFAFNFYFDITSTPGRVHMKFPWFSFSLQGDTRLTWAAGEWVHWIAAWHQVAGGNVNMELFFNDDLVASFTQPYNPPDFGTDTFNLLFRPGSPGEEWGKVIIDDLLVSKDYSYLQLVRDNYNTPGAREISIYGLIEDNRNEYWKLETVSQYGTQFIRINTSAGYSIDIPFRYVIAVEWINEDDEIVNSVIRLPELKMEALQSIDLYLSRDWSVYWDVGLTRLACTNWV